MNYQNYDNVDISNHKLVFRKVMLPRESLNTPYDFNSVKNLQKISTMLKFSEDLQLDSQVYSDNKEFLIDLVNARHSVIVQNLKHNVETLRKICIMDRNHRTDLRAKNAHLAVKNQAYDKNKISLDFQLEPSNPISTELIKEINDLNYGPEFFNKKGLNIPKTELPVVSIDEINKFISDTAENFDTDITLSNQIPITKSETFIYQFEGTDNSVKIEEIDPSIINDVNFGTTIDKTVVEKYYSTTINKNNDDSRQEFFKIVASTPINDQGVQKYTQCEIFPSINVAPVKKGLKRKFVYEKPLWTIKP